MQKKKKLVTALFVGMFLLPLNTFALTKEETVYTHLNTDGSVKSIFVTEHLKNTEKLETMTILKSTLLENIILAVTLWFFGTTVIGIPIVFGIIMYRGFCLGYSIATIISVIGVGKGILFILITLVLQNILFIPALIAIGVSRI